jgi:hypothetical protein
MEFPSQTQTKNIIFCNGTDIKTATKKVLCTSYDKPLGRTGVPKTWRRETQKYTILAAKSLGNQPLRRKNDIAE